MVSILREVKRRIAEGRFSHEKAALYFTKMDNGESILENLQLDVFGDIRNWPERFFGDETGELVAMARAAAQRKAKDEATNGQTEKNVATQ